MEMEREELLKKMKVLKAKARSARAEGKRDVARAFRAGASRLERRIRGLPKGQVAKAAE